MAERGGAARRPVIVADDAIAAVHEAFEPLGEVRAVAGRTIDRAILADADALIVRTVTRVGPALVDGTPVRFVGSATAGLDHVDASGLRARGIEVAHAPGCNATAVAEYVLAALATLHLRGIGAFPPAGPVGVVGLGAIGRRLAARLRALGVVVLACDPPLQRTREDSESAAEPFVALPELLASCSIVTLHVPLCDTGSDPTRHLLDAASLRLLPPDAIVINTSRGGVLDDAALLRWLASGRGTAILDVWETEPAPSQALVDAVALGTPHVAGYSLEGKLQATHAVHAALARSLQHAAGFDPARHVPPPARALGDAGGCTLASALATAIDLAAEDDALRGALASAKGDPVRRAAAFEHLRRAHPLRRELSAFVTSRACPAGVREALQRLGARRHD